MKIGLLTVIYGEGAGKYIRNIDAQTTKLDHRFCQLVVDHGSHDFSKKDFESRSIAYFQSKNLGFSSGVNIGLFQIFNQLKCEYVIVLNPDIQYKFDELNELQGALNEDFYVLEVIEHGEKKSIQYYSYLTGKISTSEKYFSFPYFNGAGFCISNNLYNRIGGFDIAFFLYFEDLDYSRKLYVNNVIINKIETTNLIHEVGGSRALQKRVDIERIAAISAIRFTIKWFPWNLWLIMRYMLKWLLAPFRY